MEFSMYYCFAFIFVSVQLFGFVNSQNSLYRDIMKDYDKQLLPTFGTDLTLNITVDIWPFSIHKFDETEEVLSIVFGVQFKWNDPRLLWYPQLYNWMTHFPVSTEDMWLPKFYLTNGAENMKHIGAEASYDATLVFTGDMLWMTSDIFRVKCGSDNTVFPFDTQYCSMQFMAFGLYPPLVRLFVSSQTPVTDYFYPNSYWDIVEQRQFVKDTGTSESVMFNVAIKRKPLYFVVIVVFPTLLFSLMNPLVFLLPTESGERISLGMTMLLSYAIFLTLVTAAVPASSNPLCVLLLVMVLIITISGFIVIGAIISLHYYHSEDPNDISVCIKRFAVICRCRRTKKKYSEDDDVHSVSGKDVSKAMDRVFLILSYALLVCINVGYFIYALVGYKSQGFPRFD